MHNLKIFPNEQVPYNKINSEYIKDSWHFHQRAE